MCTKTCVMYAVIHTNDCTDALRQQLLLMRRSNCDILSPDLASQFGSRCPAPGGMMSILICIKSFVDLFNTMYTRAGAVSDNLADSEKSDILVLRRVSSRNFCTHVVHAGHGSRCVRHVALALVKGKNLTTHVHRCITMHTYLLSTRKLRQRVPTNEYFLRRSQRQLISPFFRRVWAGAPAAKLQSRRCLSSKSVQQTLY